MKVDNVLVIGQDEELKEKFTTDTDSRIVAYQQLIGMCESLELKIDKTALYNDCRAEFQRAFMQENSKSVLKKLSYEKLLELMEVNTTTLNNLFTQFEANNNEFNVDTFEYEVPSFDIVLDKAEDIERYNACLKLIKAVDEFSQVQSIFYGDLVQSLRGAIIMDRGLRKLTPNMLFVKQLRF